jgi:spermidine/putrescine-binding protein
MRPSNSTYGAGPSRRRFLSIAGASSLAVGGAGLMSACGLSSGTSAGSDSTLVVATWKDYGVDLDWVATDFKQRSGATLQFKYIDSEANLIELLKSANGTIDVALPNLQYIGQAISAGLLHELDHGKLTNFPDIYPALSSEAALRSGGKLYGIPWTWGSTGLFYTPSAFPTPPTSLAVLWDPRYKGKVGLIDDGLVNVMAAALYLGEDPQNPNLSKIEPALRALKANAKIIYSSTDDLAHALSGKTVKVGIGNSDGVGGIHAGGVSDLAYTIPTQGAVGWIDNWTITAKTRRLELAYKWLNYMTSPDYLGKWANSTTVQSPAPANRKVVASLSTKIKDRIQAYPEKMNKLAMQLPHPATTLQSWVDLWQRVKSG